MTSIETKDLFVDHDGFEALKKINLKMASGEFVAVVGKSGSGKSTLLHALARLIPSSGTITCSGKLGVIFQNLAIFPWLTVEQNIAFGLDDVEQQEKKKMVNQYLRLIDLEDKAHRYSAELSGGQVQRVALARTLAPNPEILLMDEPYGALDAWTRDEMQKWLLDIWMTHKKTILFVTHSIEEAIFLVDRVLVMRAGAFIEEFNVPFDRPRTERIKFTQEFNQLKQRTHAAL